MSIECRILVGLTVEFARELNHEDFRKCHAFTEKYPELDEYEYDREDREGKLLLISDGMNGEFLRLIQVEKYIDGGNLGDTNEFIELSSPGPFNPELVAKMRALYEEYTGKTMEPKDFKYAMWSQWY